MDAYSNKSKRSKPGNLREIPSNTARSTTRKLLDTDGQIRHNLVGKVAYRWNTDEICPSVSSRRYTDIRRQFVGKIPTNTYRR